MNRLIASRPASFRELSPAGDPFLCAGISVVAFSFVMGVILFAALIGGN